MNRLALLKHLAPGFLPLIVFIVADSIWGTRIGLIVAVGVGIIELIYSYVKEKILDRFVLFDIGLIVMLGLVSILLDNDIFFKLKPALIELLFCIILGLSAYSRFNIIMLISKRYMKGVTLSTAQIEELGRSLKVLFYLFIGHTVLIVYAAFQLSRAAWAFISGGLFYIIFAVYFLVEILTKKRKQKQLQSRYGDDEWFDLVDEEGKVTGRAPRTLCHSGPGMLHPVVHLHIFDDRDRIFLQKRPLNKQIQPGKWDTAVGGHISSGETLEKALSREAEEELAITDFKPQLLARYLWETEVESELVFTFVACYTKAISINREEIDDGRFWKLKKIRENLGKGLFTPNFEHEFKMLVQQFFKS